MLRYLAALGSLALVACSHTAHVSAVAAPVVADSRPAAPTEVRPDTIVLFGDHASAQLDSTGAALDATDAFRIAAGAHVMAVKQEEKSDTFSCDLDYDSGPFHQEGEFFSRSLALTTPSGPDLVIVPPMQKEKEPNVIVEEKMTAAIQGVVGPYLFVSIAQSFFGCGAAHPIGGTTASVWDIRLGKEVELTPPAGATDRARTALKDRGFEDEVHLVEARPRFDPQGRLAMSWRFEKRSGYADSDGEGHAYTVSAWVDADDLPAELAPLAEPPAALASYLKTHPGPITGWSRLD